MVGGSRRKQTLLARTMDKENLDVSSSSTSYTKSEPWSPFLPEIVAHQAYLTKLYDDIGHPPDVRERLTRQLFSNFNEVLQKYRVTAEKQRDSIRREVEDVNRRVREFRVLMGEPAGNEITTAGQQSESLSIRLKSLKMQEAVLKERYNNNLVQVQDLIAKINQLRPVLGNYIRIRQSDDDRIASTERLTSLERELERCNRELRRRYNELDAKVHHIVNLWRELGMAAEKELDRDILEHNRGQRILPSDENLNRLQAKEQMLEAQKMKTQKKTHELQNKITNLWNKLRIPNEEREEFSKTHRGYTQDVLHAYESHLDYLIQLKHEHMDLLIKYARDELTQLWDALFYSERERLAFTPAYTDKISEDVLKAHEDEIWTLKNKVEELRPLLEKIERHRMLVDEFEEFETIVNDPNRPPPADPEKLVQEEESIRNRITQELPKLESELEVSLRAWEQRNNRPFLVYGRPYLIYMREYTQGSARSSPSRSSPTRGSPSRYSPSRLSPTRQTPSPTRSQTPPSYSPSESIGTQTPRSMSQPRGWPKRAASPRRAPFPGSRKFKRPFGTRRTFPHAFTEEQEYVPGSEYEDIEGPSHIMDEKTEVSESEASTSNVPVLQQTSPPASVSPDSPIGRKLSPIAQGSGAGSPLPTRSLSPHVTRSLSPLPPRGNSPTPGIAGSARKLRMIEEIRTKSPDLFASPKLVPISSGSQWDEEEEEEEVEEEEEQRDASEEFEEGGESEEWSSNGHFEEEPHRGGIGSDEEMQYVSAGVEKTEEDDSEEFTDELTDDSEEIRALMDIKRRLGVADPE